MPSATPSTSSPKASSRPPTSSTLPIQTADNVTRTPNLALGAQNPLNNEKVLKALFSDDALKNKRNPEAVQVGPTTLVAARIVDYRPATARKFEDVEAQVRQAYVASQAAELARKDGEAKLEALKKADSAAGFGQDCDGVAYQGRRPVAEGGRGHHARRRERAARVWLAWTSVQDGYAIYRIGEVSSPTAGEPGASATPSRSSWPNWPARPNSPPTMKR